MDGYAVFAADSSPWREVIGEQHAGTVLDVEVTDGYTVKIMTGAPVPRGADAVVPIEATELADDHVVIHKEDVQPGENIRPIGSDVREGDLVLPRGTVLGPAEIGLVANMGIDPVRVSRRPRVSVLSTGDELVEPAEPLGPGQIRDSNRFSLRTALLAEGCEITFAGKAPDKRDELEAFLRERMGVDDIVITSGGVSMGDLDLIKAILFDADGRNRALPPALPEARQAAQLRHPRQHAHLRPARQPGLVTGDLRGVHPARAAGDAGSPDGRPAKGARGPGTSAGRLGPDRVSAGHRLGLRDRATDGAQHRAASIVAPGVVRRGQCPAGHPAARASLCCRRDRPGDDAGAPFADE